MVRKFPWNRAVKSVPTDVELSPWRKFARRPGKQKKTLGKLQGIQKETPDWSARSVTQHSQLEEICVVIESVHEKIQKISWGVWLKKVQLKSDLKRHMDTHINLCSKFLACRCLRKHIKAVHEKVRNFSSDFFSFSFFMKSNIRRHIARHASNPNFKPHQASDACRPFKCTSEGCGKF